MNHEMTLDEFLELTSAIKGYRPKSLRLGQWAYTLLFDYHQQIAQAINGTEFDPFFDDSRIPAFLGKLLTIVRVDTEDDQ